MTEKQEVPHVHAMITPSGFEELLEHIYLAKSTSHVDPAGQKPNTLNPDLVK